VLLIPFISTLYLLQEASGTGDRVVVATGMESVSFADLAGGGKVLPELSELMHYAFGCKDATFGS
jgi:hypothetical protein